MFDIVFDYRRNDIGFFLSPGGGVQVNVLDAGLSAGVGPGASWGTVASFGEPSHDVIGSFGGWFTNVNYGLQGKLAVEGAPSLDRRPVLPRRLPGLHAGGISYTPFGADTDAVPGRPACRARPGRRTTPSAGPAGGEHGAAPRRHSYPTQGDTPDRARSRPPRTAPTRSRRAPPGRHTGVDAPGHSSRGWRPLPPGQTREEANRALSERRGSKVASASAAVTPLRPRPRGGRPRRRPAARRRPTSHPRTSAPR